MPVFYDMWSKATALMVLNEPEASLHSHAARLISALEQDPDRIVGQRLLDQPPWHWPER